MFFSPIFFYFSLFSFLLFSVCNEDYPCEGMSRHATFENFGMAFLTLFQVSTGDNWNGIMKVQTYSMRTYLVQSTLPNLVFVKGSNLMLRGVIDKPYFFTVTERKHY